MTPEILTLSKFVWPSTSKSLTLISGVPVKLLARDAVPVDCSNKSSCRYNTWNACCFAKKVVPVTVVIPAKVDTPITFKLLVLTFVVEPPPAAAVIVTIPADIGER